jgi:DNA-directed RNA polymerase specialized sigma24 family protein
MTNLEDLVASAKAGDEVAFTRLIDAEARWAYGTAKAIVGFGGEAEDVFQEACLRAWRDLPNATCRSCAAPRCGASGSAGS